mgnify:FL=1
MKDLDILKTVIPVTKAFEKLGVIYYIGGSVASSAYGVARATMDVDCVSDLSSGKVKHFVEMLEGKYYVDEQMIQDAIRQCSSFNLIHLETMLKVDVFIVKKRPYDQGALRRRKKDTLDDDKDTPEIYLASSEDVLVSKLDWFQRGGRTSEKQWNDILGVLKVQKGYLDMEYLNHWARELDLIDLLEKAFTEAGITS